MRTHFPRTAVAPFAVLELLKPVTWFPPMWAFACGVVGAGTATGGRWPVIIAGVVLAGPLVCGCSQAVNDWYDRHVDAINEPNRPIPSGRIPGELGFYIAVGWTLLSLGTAALLGTTVLYAAAVGLFLAWVYSAPPLRLKQNGWWGNAACGLAYEGLAWLTGTAVMTGGQLTTPAIALALLYSFGAHGIMTLNDFKSVVGDAATGIGSLPVRLGVVMAGRVACVFMALSQVGVAALLWTWGLPIFAIAIAILVVLQLRLMVHLLGNPAERAPWYNATGVGLYVAGMMISAIGIRGL